MYRKPGFYEVSLGQLALGWARSLYEVKGASVTFETNISELFRSMSSNLTRRLRFVQLEDVLTANSEASPIDSDSQKAFAHLVSRWLVHLSVFEEYPAVIAYARTPRVKLDECIDFMLEGRVLFPSWEDIGDKEAKLEAIIPIFIAFVRNIIALSSLRVRFVGRLRAKLADIGYRIASGATIDQFDKTFFLAYSSMTNDYAQSVYSPIGAPLPVTENADKNVDETYGELKGKVEAGPYTRFGVLISNKLPQELFAFFGPYTPTLEFNYGYLSKVGKYRRVHIDERETVNWSMEEQEDAIRMQSQALSPGVSNVLTISQPIIEYHAQRAELMDDPSAMYVPGLDVPDVVIRMANGFASTTDQRELDWFSPTRGRQISTSRGANAEVFLQDLALKHDRFGDAQVGITSLSHWKLVDPACLPGLGRKFVQDVNYKEKILFVRPDGNTIEMREVDMTAFYTLRGAFAMRPAFTEYVALHRNSLRQVDLAAEAYITRSLDLSRMGRRRSEQVIRLSHRWNVLKRLFDVSIMSFKELRQLAHMQEGALTESETTSESEE